MITFSTDMECNNNHQLSFLLKNCLIAEEIRFWVFYNLILFNDNRQFSIITLEKVIVGYLTI